MNRTYSLELHAVETLINLNGFISFTRKKGGCQVKGRKKSNPNDKKPQVFLQRNV